VEAPFLGVLGHDQVVAGQDVAGMVDHLVHRIEAQPQAGDDLVGPVGDVVVGGGDVGVFGLRGEEGRQPVPVLGVQQGPEAVDGCSVALGVAHRPDATGPVNTT